MIARRYSSTQNIRIQVTDCRASLAMTNLAMAQNRNHNCPSLQQYTKHPHSSDGLPHFARNDEEAQL